MISTIEELELAALNIRKNLLELCTKEVIHIGGDLSVTDVMTVLWQYQMKYDPKDIKNENRDRFILSKGHAGPVMYATLGIMGYYPVEEADVHFPYISLCAELVFNRAFYLCANPFLHERDMDHYHNRGVCDDDAPYCSFYDAFKDFHF